MTLYKNFYRVTISLIFILSLILTIWTLETYWVSASHKQEMYFSVWLYWFAWAGWIALWFGLRYLLFPARSRSRWRYAGMLMLTLLCAIGLWARFIEPNLVVVQRTYIQAPFQKKVALIADLHIGLFDQPRDLERWVNKINSLDLDEVWVAGDWTYEPPHDLERVFAALAKLKYPVYSVTGNHDEQRPGPPLEEALNQTLNHYGVHNLDNQLLDRGDFYLLGLSYRLTNKRVRASLHLPTDKPMLILAHQPDTALQLGTPYLLMVSGHTHGGQVQIPWLTAYILKDITVMGYDEGLYQTEHGLIYVTRGLGMIGLPVRLGNIPVIDVLEFGSAHAASLPQQPPRNQP